MQFIYNTGSNLGFNVSPKNMSREAGTLTRVPKIGRRLLCRLSPSHCYFCVKDPCSEQVDFQAPSFHSDFTTTRTSTIRDFHSLVSLPLFFGAAASSVGDVDGGHSLQILMNSYQMMFFTLFALLAGTAIIIIGGSHFPVDI